MELQKRAFELVVDSMLPGLDAELGAFDEILSIFGTSRLGNRRRVLQWVGRHYLVVGRTKLNEYYRLRAEWAVLEKACKTLPYPPMEHWHAMHCLEMKQDSFEPFFHHRRIFDGTGHSLRWTVDCEESFWDAALSVTLTKWSRLRD